MKVVLLLISVFLLAVAIDAKGLGLATNLLNKFGRFGRRRRQKKSKQAFQHCLSKGRIGTFTWGTPYYQSRFNKTLYDNKNYINVRALTHNGTHTIYNYDCRDPRFKTTELCQDIANEEDGTHAMCSTCFGQTASKLIKTITMAGEFGWKISKKRIWLQISLDVTCDKPTNGPSIYTYTVTDRVIDTKKKAREYNTHMRKIILRMRKNKHHSRHRKRRRLLQRKAGNCRL